MFSRMILTCLLIVSLSTGASAWSNRGHEIIAQIAWQLMDSSTKAKLTYYLDGMTIEQASTWMNDVIDSPQYAYMKEWHYYRYEFPSDYMIKSNIKSEWPTDPNLLQQLKRVATELQKISSLPDSIIRLDLLVFIHLTEDLYEPLNRGYMYRDTLGNVYKLGPFFFDSGKVAFSRKQLTLRQVWDSALIEYVHLTPADCMGEYDTSQLKRYKGFDIAEWGSYSQRLLPGVVYYNAEPPYLEASWQTYNSGYYLDRCLFQVKRLLLRSGIRVATSLKELLK